MADAGWPALRHSWCCSLRYTHTQAHTHAHTHTHTHTHCTHLDTECHVDSRQQRGHTQDVGSMSWSLDHPPDVVMVQGKRPDTTSLSLTNIHSLNIFLGSPFSSSILSGLSISYAHLSDTYIGHTLVHPMHTLL